MPNAMAIQPVASEMFDITDCIVVITGGESGIGAMIAKSLAANGAKVYVLGRRLEVLEKAAKEMCQLNGRTATSCGLHRPDRRPHHLLINNAGIATPNLESHQARPSPKWDIKKVRDFWFSKKFSDYAAELETNTTAALQATFAFPELLDKGNKFRERQEAAAKSNGKVFRGPYTYTRSQVLTLSSVGGFGRDNSAFIHGDLTRFYSGGEVGAQC